MNIPVIQTPPVPLAARKWEAITEEFYDSCKVLDQGELEFADGYTLTDAMSAIELMDPKMDAGMTYHQRVKKFTSLQDGIEKGVIKLENISDQEIIEISDGILFCLVSFFEGSTLPQTVFQCAYLHEPMKVGDETLKTICLLSLKILQSAFSLIELAAVYMEEDVQFVGAHKDFSFQPEVTETKVLKMSNVASDKLLHAIKKLKVSQESTAVEQKLKEGLLSRIHFFRSLLLILNTSDEMEMTKLIHSCHDLLKSMKQTQTDSKVEDIMGFEPLLNDKMLTPSYPRQVHIPDFTEASSYLRSFLDRLRDYKAIKGKVDNPATANIAAITDALAQFASKSPGLLLRSKIQMIFKNDEGGQNVELMREIIRNSLKSFINPVFYSNKELQSSEELMRCLEDFTRDAVSPFSYIIQTFNFNRARQRERWANLLQEEYTFGILTLRAWKLDTTLTSVLRKNEEEKEKKKSSEKKKKEKDGNESSSSSSSPPPPPPEAPYAEFDPARPMESMSQKWVALHILESMMKYLMQGFHLELYSPHELFYIYWYLSEVIISQLIKCYGQADEYLQAQAAQAAAAANGSASSGGSGGTSGSRKNKKKIKKKAAAAAAGASHEQEISYLQCLHDVASAFQKAFQGLMMAGKITLPVSSYDKEDFRYNHRLRPFISLSWPAFVPYDKFKQSVTFPPAIYTVDRILHISTLYLKDAVEQLSQLPNQTEQIVALQKVAKTNIVVFNILAGGHNLYDKIPVKLDYSCHYAFPIVRL